MKAQRNRRLHLGKWALLIVLAVSVMIFLKIKKDDLEKRFASFLASCLSAGTSVTVQMGRIEGRFPGVIRFKNIEVGPEEFFKAKEVAVHYHFLDLFLKNADSKIGVDVTNPEVWWRPHVGVKKPAFPFLDWLRKWALSQRRNLRVKVEDLELSLGSPAVKLEGIMAQMENDHFVMEVPVRHLEIFGSDVSSTVKINGKFQLGLGPTDDRIIGKISTEGTVVNWKPLADESTFDFIFSKQGFEIVSSNFLGGIRVNGTVNFLQNYDIDFQIQTHDYPLSRWDAFVKSTQGISLPGRLDLEASFKGSPWAPVLESRTRIVEGWAGKTAFKVLDIHLAGVYPTLKLTDSHILLSDETSMRFADTTLEFEELFQDKVLARLVSEAQQDSVVWGDWKFERPKDASDPEQFSMQHMLGDKASVHLRTYNADESSQSNDSEPMEVGLEYRLRSKDSLKLELREEEQFLGVERKLKF